MTAPRRGTASLLRSRAALALCASVAAASSATGRAVRMAPSDLEATMVVGRPPGVAVEELTPDAVPTTLTLAPLARERLRVSREVAAVRRHGPRGTA